MIRWADEGLILSARRHGESDAILDALTADHGRHAGIVKGGGGRRRAQLQPGATLRLEWRARLSEHLGTYAAEPVRDRAGAIMADADALAALASVAALLAAFLPEREPCPELYRATVALADALTADAWQGAYARWELGLLEALGYGLDLSECAATGANDRLVWVSPRTGRAVSASAGAPYADRLLPLPAFLLDDGAPCGPRDVADALRLTGHFLDARVAREAGVEAAPAARRRLAARLAAHASAG